MKKITAHNKVPVQRKLADMLYENETFKKNGFIYVITSEKQAKGEIKGLTIDRMKAKRMCFTKIKHVRKAFYTKVVNDYNVPLALLKELESEIGMTVETVKPLKKARK